MINVDGVQTCTSSWVTINSMNIDTNVGSQTRFTYYFEATTNDITLSTKNLYDLSNQTIINVLSGGSAVAVISPEDLDGINSGFQYYRVQIKGSSPYGTIAAWADGK